MNSSQRKSLELTKKWLSSVEDDVFYSEYQELNNGIGQTISTYKNNLGESGMVIYDQKERTVVLNNGEVLALSCGPVLNETASVLVTLLDGGITLQEAYNDIISMETNNLNRVLFGGKYESRYVN